MVVVAAIDGMTEIIKVTEVAEVIVEVEEDGQEEIRTGSQDTEEEIMTTRVEITKEEEVAIGEEVLSLWT